MLRLIVVLTLLAVAIGGLLFGTLNAEPITLNYYLGSIQMPLAAAVTLALMVGLLVGAFCLWLGTSLPLKARNRGLRRRIAALEREVSEKNRELVTQDAESLRDD